ncbi:metal-binding protein [Wenzhouxiangella marina]|uniref:Metal-binding protein n=1 Tax=Wenzhouxiangella marina TaxID=1579979 RepID=A0A0K0XSC1_9GAMM|nr:metal-binding protein [Wenzhouxiangella marina]
MIVSGLHRWLGLFLLVLLLGSAAYGREDQHVLVIGRVSDDPAAHYDRLKPLLDYVVERLGDVGIREGRILMARDGQAMISYLRQGRVDWVTETAGASVAMIDRGGAELLLKGWRGGRSQYQSLFVVRRDSGIENLDALRGHSVGFQHPMSTSAYLVPAGMLLEAQLDVAVLLSPLDRPSPDFVGYAFTGTETNSVAWVHKRIVDAAAISNQDWETLIEPVPAYAADLRIIDRSPDYPRALELVRGSLDPEIRRRLREVLLAAASDPAAAPALSNYFRTERFTLPDEETLAQLATLRRLAARVRQSLE